MTPRMRRLVAVAAFLAVIPVAACAPTVDAAWAPPAWPTTALRVVDAPPAPLDAAGVRGLSGQRLRNDAVGVYARFAHLPGTGPSVAPFNRAVDGIVRAAIDARVAAAGVAYTPEVFPVGAGLASRGCVAGSAGRAAADLLSDPEIGAGGAARTAVACDIVAAAGPILAERMRVVSGDASGVASDVTTTLYADTSDGTVATADALWTDAAAGTLGPEVVEAVRRDAGAIALTPPDGDAGDVLGEIRTALSSTVPSSDGDLVFTIAEGFTTPELTSLGLEQTTRPVSVAVPASVAEPLLTPFGRTVLAAAGAPYTGPDAVPASAEWLDCRLVPCVAITYDDGPGDLTPTLLDELRDAHATATFFMLGGNASRHPDTVRRVSAEGHEIGAHTWNHPHLPTLDDDAVTHEVGDSRAILQQLSGQPVPMFRPPYGEYDARVLALAGLPAILWNVDTRDWEGPADDVLLRRGVDEAKPGGIILFHDIHGNSVRVAPDVIAGLRDRGFTPASIAQLFGGAPPASGAWRGAPQQ